MFNNYEEYDNIDNEVYDVYNLYAKTITPLKKQDTPKPVATPVSAPVASAKKEETPVKKVNFSEKVELFPGSPPEYDVFRSCGDNCKLKENKVIYEGFCQGKKQLEQPISRSGQMYDYYNSLPLSGYEIMLLFILVIFIVYVKQRLDNIEIAMMFLSMQHANSKTA